WNTTRRRSFSNASVCHSPMSARDCLSGGIEPRGVCASRAGYGAKGEGARPKARRLRPQIWGKTSGYSCQYARIHEHSTCRDALSNRKGDEKMRVSRLITISTVAVLMGGTSFAIGQASQASAASQQAAQEGGTISQGGPRG